ncbi:hypothetical protein MKW94_016361 [Papaver nudicaule]|uniref:Uncharacterized protein n=1 Tax=Papaver nudicaule TaxID=74823 RepID=A0AA41RQ90_PAPNU|nr:hypothetical protein [Papaver nudicaule]
MCSLRGKKFPGTALLCSSLNGFVLHKFFSNFFDFVHLQCYACVLEYWVGRGMLQIFVGVMTRTFPDVTGRRKELVDLHDISSYLLLACGATYVISGLLCIGSLKRARQQKETTREQAVKDLEIVCASGDELHAIFFNLDLLFLAILICK